MVEEVEYRKTYRQVNESCCAFEKALLMRGKCRCSRAKLLRLGERLAYGCNHHLAQQRCIDLLQRLRGNARFALGMSRIEGPLPHNKEIRVQVGGLLGLQKLCGEPVEEAGKVADADASIECCISRYGGIDELPWNELVQSIGAYEVPTWRQRRKQRRAEKDKSTDSDDNKKPDK